MQTLCQPILLLGILVLGRLYGADIYTQEHLAKDISWDARQNNGRPGAATNSTTSSVKDQSRTSSRLLTSEFDGVPPLHVLTNVLAVMDYIVEARCVVLVGLRRFADITGRDDWSRLLRDAELCGSIFRGELMSMLYPKPEGVPWEEALDANGQCVLDRSRRLAKILIMRNYSGSISHSRDIAYAELVRLRMTETERRLYVAAHVRMKAILLDEFTAILLEMEGSGTQRSRTNAICDFLLFTQRQRIQSSSRREVLTDGGVTPENTGLGPRP